MADATPPNQTDRLAVIGKWGGLALFLLMLLLPTPGDIPPVAYRMAALTLLMAILWITQPIPIAATSLLPLVLFPVLGIQSAKEVSKAYIDQNVFLFLGGFVIAMGIEKWGLHRRMALQIIRLLGTGLRRVVLGFMAATAFLSMWISNTASTLMMLPIGLALVSSIREISVNDTNGTERHHAEQTVSHFATVLMISIAYAASIGGFTTLVGTPTNVAFVGIWGTEFPAETYPDAPTFSAGEWIVAALPVGLLMLGCAWGLLTWRLPNRIGKQQLDRSFFTNRLRALGPATSAENRMLVVFTITALLWIFRKPLVAGDVVLVPGWGNLVADALSDWGVTPAMIHDSTVAIGMAVLLFFIPSGTTKSGQTEYLMDWQTAENLPWGILLLIGGGFAIAGGFKSSGLAEWVGGEFAYIVKSWHPLLLVLSACLLMTFLTELTSNVAVVSALMPILAGTAVAIGVDPRLIMIPAVISASCAFMLPIATPPNAIVFGSGRVRMNQMVSYGIVLNLIGAVVITAATFLLLAPQLGITVEGLPGWLHVKK